MSPEEARPKASTVDVLESPVRDLDPHDSQRFFDAKARELLGISGDEFLRRWAAGDYDDVADDPAHADVMYLVRLGSGGR